MTEAITNLDRIRKRRHYPMPFDGGEVHVRALTHSEIRIVRKFSDEDESAGFVIGCALLNEDGSEKFIRGQDEDPKAFGERVMNEIDLPSDTSADLVKMITRLSQGSPVDVIAKN